MYLRGGSVLLLALASLCASVLPGCGGSDSPGASAQGAGGPAIPRSAPEIEVPEGLPPERLVVKDLRKGTGARARWGDTVKLHYYGVEWNSGATHSDSWSYSGIPSFKLAKGERGLLRGLKLAIPGMKERGSREVIIPHNLLHYPGESRPPPGRLAALIYKVYLVEVLRAKAR